MVYNYLIGDGVRNPIVKANSRSQLLGSPALPYRF